MRVVTPPALAVEPALADVVRPVVAAVDDLVARLDDPALGEALRTAAEALRKADDPGRSTATTAVRAMYRQVGIDPTRTRPSSEALLRRVRRGDPLPRVNSLVDVINWCSVEVQLPFGLYDRGAVDGDVRLRLGGPDEQYAGIRKDVVHLAGRPTLVDRRGPFGNPTSDSARTSVTVATTRILVVVFVPATLSPDLGERALALTTARLASYASAPV